MRFPFKSNGELRRVEDSGSLWVEYQSSAPIDIVAPYRGVVAPVLNSGLDIGGATLFSGSDWSLAFFPQGNFATEHSFVDGWKAPIPNAFVIRCSRFAGETLLKTVVLTSIEASGGIILTRRDPATGSTVEEPFSVPPEQRDAAAGTFVDNHWWDRTRGWIRGGAAEITLPFSPNALMLSVDGPVTIGALYTEDPEGALLSNVNRPAPLFHFDAREYLQRLADSGLIEDLATTPLRARDDSARAAAFANNFQIEASNGIGPTLAYLRGGLQRVELQVQAGRVRVPEAIFVASPSNTADPVLDADGSTASGEPPHWYMSRAATGATDLGTSDHIDITWAQLDPPTDGATPFTRTLSNGTCEIEFSAVRNFLQDVTLAIEELVEVQRRELDVLAQSPPGHGRTTYAELELLRHVLDQVVRIDVTSSQTVPWLDVPIGTAIRNQVPRFYSERRPRELEEAPARRAQLVEKIRQRLGSAFLEQLNLAGPAGEDLLTDLPLILGSIPEGQVASQALHSLVTPSFIASRLRQGVSGLRSGLSLITFSYMKMAAAAIHAGTTTDARTFLNQFVFAHLDEVIEVLDDASVPTETLSSHVFNIEEGGQRLTVRVAPNLSTAHALTVIRTIETSLAFFNVTVAVFALLDEEENDAVDYVNASRHIAKFTQNWLELAAQFNSLASLQQRVDDAAFALIGRTTRSSVATAARLSALGVAAGLLSIASLAGEIYVLIQQAGELSERGMPWAATFTYIAAVGCFAMIVGTVGTAFLLFPVAGAVILFFGMIISFVGYIGAAISAYIEGRSLSSTDPQAISFRAFLEKLSRCYFGRDHHSDSREWDNIPLQISNIIGRRFTLSGVYSLAGNSIYLEIYGNVLDLAPDRDERIIISIRDAAGASLFSVGFNFRDVGSGMVLAEHPNVAVTIDHLIRIRSTAERPIAFDRVDEVEVGVSLGGFSFPPETETQISEAYEELFDEDRYAFMARDELSLVDPLPSKFDPLVRVWP